MQFPYLPDNPPVGDIQPLSFEERSSNELRPDSLDEMIGQNTLKPLLRRIIDVAKATEQPLDHVLLTGPSGTGKTTVAQIVARELGVRVFQVKAPVSLDTFGHLGAVMCDREVLIVDEIHQQVSGDRRGVTQACDPEAFFHIMEDRKLVTETGMLPFPAITIIGATTDEGLLPEPFLNRFPLRPRLQPYTVEDMNQIVLANTRALHLIASPEAVEILARASRGVPRLANNYVRNARMLALNHMIDRRLAREVVEDLNSTTLDGLTQDMQRMLTFLYVRGRRMVKGETRYQASVNTVATALGKSRDTKVVALYVEPYLIERGLVEVQHNGRTLTEAGATRAKELLAA